MIDLKTNDNYIEERYKPSDSLAGKTETEQKFYFNYNKFTNSRRYDSGELIRDICHWCEKERCKCGGCPETDFYKIVNFCEIAPGCQRCICEDNIPKEDIEIKSDSGKTLDELQAERKGKTLKDYSEEAYERGEFTKIGGKREH